MYVFKLLINRVRASDGSRPTVSTIYVTANSEEDIREHYKSVVSGFGGLLIVTNIGKLLGHINPDFTMSDNTEL